MLYVYVLYIAYIWYNWYICMLIMFEMASLLPGLPAWEVFWAFWAFSDVFFAVCPFFRFFDLPSPSSPSSPSWSSWSYWSSSSSWSCWTWKSYCATWKINENHKQKQHKQLIINSETVWTLEPLQLPSLLLPHLHQTIRTSPPPFAGFRHLSQLHWSDPPDPPGHATSGSSGSPKSAKSSKIYTISHIFQIGNESQRGNESIQDWKDTCGQFLASISSPAGPFLFLSFLPSWIKIIKTRNDDLHAEKQDWTEKCDKTEGHQKP